MFIPNPDFYTSRIPDPKTATKEQGCGSGFNRVSGSGSRRAKMTHISRKKI
jgi:hypothetical protein